MSRVAARAERERPRALIEPSRPEAYGFPEAVAEAACRAAEVLHAKAIVAFTQSGFSARLISSERPDVPVVALTPFPEVQRRLGGELAAHSQGGDHGRDGSRGRGDLAR